MHRGHRDASRSKDRFIRAKKYPNFIDDDTPRSESTDYTHLLKSIHEEKQWQTDGHHFSSLTKQSARSLSVQECLAGKFIRTNNAVARRTVCMFKHWDVPGIVDDFYQDVMDWGSMNLCLAIASQVILTSSNGEFVPIKRKPMKTRRNRYRPEELSDSWVTALKLHSSNLAAAAGSDTGHLEIYDLEKICHSRLAKVSSSKLNCITWNNDHPISGGRDGRVKYFDLRNACPEKSTISISPGAQVCGLAVNSNYVAVGSDDWAVRIWDLRHIGEGPVVKMESYQAAVKALDWCPWNSHLLATGAGRSDGRVVIWNTVSLPKMVAQKRTKSAISTVLWNPLYNELITSHGAVAVDQVQTSTAQSCINIWNPSNMSTPKASIKAHKQRILKICLNPKKDELVSLGADEALKFWKLNAQPDEVVKASLKRSLLY